MKMLDLVLKSQCMLLLSNLYWDMIIARAVLCGRIIFRLKDKNVYKSFEMIFLLIELSIHPYPWYEYVSICKIIVYPSMGLIDMFSGSIYSNATQHCSTLVSQGVQHFTSLNNAANIYFLKNINSVISFTSIVW